MKDNYTFATDNSAEKRLGEIAAFFNPLAEAWLRENLAAPVAAAIDLGCGPGFTTVMLAQATGASRVVGLDMSEEALSQARARLPEAEFLQCDLASSPLPVKGEAVYARFVLSHLPKPLEALGRWVESLPAGARLFLDEQESIETEAELFRTYIDTNAALIASRGGRLHVGNLLDGFETAGARVVSNETVRIPVADAQAAAWFIHNTQSVWETSDFVRERLSDAIRRNVAEEFDRMRRSESTESNITWSMRRVVIERQA